MNQFTPLAQQIADEAGVPQNVKAISRQIDMNLDARRARDAFVGKWFADGNIHERTRSGSYEFAKRIAGNCLTDEERAGLAIYLIDSIDRVGADLRVETETCLAEVLSGVRT